MMASFVVPGSRSPVELEEEPGDTRGRLFNNGAGRNQRSKWDKFQWEPASEALLRTSRSFRFDCLFIRFCLQGCVCVPGSAGDTGAARNPETDP